MSRSATFLLIALASSVATPLVVRASGPVGASADRTAPIKVAEVVPAATVAPATASAPAAPCTRKVRVVYQGLGPAPDTCVTPR